MKQVLIFAAIFTFAAVAFFLGRPSQATISTNASLESLLVDDGRDSGSFSHALIPNDIQFPRDLGAHEEYQTEWWYYTGNLQTDAGRPLGFQFTIFRRALFAEQDMPNSEKPSNWRSNQLYLAHFTISDIFNEKFYTAERFGRDVGGLAGARAVPYKVWLEDWSAEEIAPGKVHLQAQTDDVALDLLLRETLPPLLHGDGGLSQKGAEPGNASYYYSIVQQETSGELIIEGEPLEVTGISWKDHEYATSALSPGSEGWDWFSLQLNDGSALMLFQIRGRDGVIDSFSSGSFMHPDGSLEHLALGAWELNVLDTWISPTSGAEYPVAWRLALPQIDLKLQGQAMMPNQELNVSTVYWEGAVNFMGSRAGQPVEANGYIEMTGYAN